jgi:hypothetical protein
MEGDGGVLRKVSNMENIQHPTSNIQHPKAAIRRTVGRWVLHVGCWVFGLLGLWLGASALLHAAQPLPFGKITNWKFQDFFDAPDQSKVRAYAQGAQAVPGSASTILVSNLHIETFQVDGTRESIIDAPECIFNYVSRTAMSAGAVNARTADGRIRLEGTGFLLTLTNKSLIISNNLKTAIRDLGTLTKKP